MVVTGFFAQCSLPYLCTSYSNIYDSVCTHLFVAGRLFHTILAAMHAILQCVSL